MYSTLTGISLILLVLAFILGIYKLLREKAQIKNPPKKFSASAYCNAIYRDLYTRTDRPKKQLKGETYEAMIWRLVNDELDQREKEHPNYLEMKQYVRKQMSK